MSGEPGWKNHYTSWTEKTLLKAISLYKERAKTLKEIIDGIGSLYEGAVPCTGSETDFKNNEAVSALQTAYDALENTRYCFS